MYHYGWRRILKTFTSFSEREVLDRVGRCATCGSAAPPLSSDKRDSNWQSSSFQWKHGYSILFLIQVLQRCLFHFSTLTDKLPFCKQGWSGIGMWWNKLCECAAMHWYYGYAPGWLEWHLLFDLHHKDPTKGLVEKLKIAPCQGGRSWSTAFRGPQKILQMLSESTRLQNFNAVFVIFCDKT